MESSKNMVKKEKLEEAQRLINLEIPVLVRSLKSSNVELVSTWIGDCSSVA